MEQTAYIGNILGNYDALRSVTEDIERRGIHQVICVGDIVGLGPEPAASIETVKKSVSRIRLTAHYDDEDKERTMLAICAGLYDSLVADPELAERYSKKMSVHELELIEWTRSQLSPEQLQFLEEFPQALSYDRQHGGKKVTILAAHHGFDRPHYFKPSQDIAKEQFKQHMIPTGTFLFIGAGEQTTLYEPEERLLIPYALTKATRGVISTGRVHPIGEPQYPEFIAFDGTAVRRIPANFDDTQVLEKIMAMDVSLKTRQWLGKRLIG